MTKLLEAAAKVRAITETIQLETAALNEHKAEVARLEQRLPILENDLSVAEAELSLAAKNHNPEAEVDEGAVATFPTEPIDTGSDPVAESPAFAGGEDVAAGAGSADLSPDGGNGLDASGYPAGEQAPQGETVLVDELVRDTITITDQVSGDSVTIDRETGDPINDGLDQEPFASHETPGPDELIDTEQSATQQDVSNDLRASAAMLNELDAEDGEGPAF